MAKGKSKKSRKKTQVIGEKPKQKEEELEIEMTDEELGEIWKVIQDLPADEAREFLKQFPKEVITKLRTAKNPFKLPVFKGSDHRA